MRPPTSAPADSAPVAARALLALLTLCPALHAQTSEPEQPTVHARMQAAIATQRQSVQLQKDRQAEINELRRLMAASIDKQRESIQNQVRAAKPHVVGPPPPVDDWAALQPPCAPVPRLEIDPYIHRIAKREGLAPELLRAVIGRESAFQPCAVSSKGALGMMQLMPETAAELGVVDPFDPLENIDGGARYLNYLLERFGGNLVLALAGYNAGPTRVTNYQGVPPIRETEDYIADILEELRMPAIRRADD